MEAIRRRLDPASRYELNPMIKPNESSSNNSLEGSGGIRGLQPSQHEAVAEQEKSLEARGPPEGLSQYFSEDAENRHRYTDGDCNDIAKLLRQSGRKGWPTIPRIYIVLRTIKQLRTIDRFLDAGIDDLWLPLSYTSLPDDLPSTSKKSFLEAQHIVLTKGFRLECGDRNHASFGRGERLPFDVLEVLGKGGFSNIHKIRSLATNTCYARKTFRRLGKDNTKIFTNELEIMKKINHIHCVQIVSSYADPDHFCLIMLPVADCNLFDFYTRVAGSDDKLVYLRSFFGCLASALSYLHRSKIRHRDIKPANILVRGNNVFLADFGVSLDWAELSGSTTTEITPMTWMYCSPEVFDHEARNVSSDIWSLGCVFLEIYTVLKGRTILDLRQHLDAKQERLYFRDTDAVETWSLHLKSVPAVLDDQISPWVELMLRPDRRERISAPSLHESIMRSTFQGQTCRSSFAGDCCIYVPEFETSHVIHSMVSVKNYTADATQPIVKSNDSQSSSLRLRPTITKMIANGGEAYAKRSKDSTSDASDRPTAASESAHTRKSAGESSSLTTQYAAPPEAVAPERLSQEHVTQDGSPSPYARDDNQLVAYSPWTQEISNQSSIIPSPPVQPSFVLPALPAIIWRHPETFLYSVQHDDQFIAFLDLNHPELYARIRVATLKDVPALLGGLLKNRIHPNDASYIDTAPEYSGECPHLWVLHDNWTKHFHPTMTFNLLLNFGAKVVQYKTADNYTSLHRSCSQGFADIVKLLLAQGADVNLNAGCGTPLQMAVSSTCFDDENIRMEIVQVLLQQGANVYPGNAYHPPLTTAVEAGQHQVSECLLRHGARASYTASPSKFCIDGQDMRGATALMIAALKGFDKITAMILESDNGEEKAITQLMACKTFHDGSTALHLACNLPSQSENRGIIVALLIKYGAEPNITNKNGESPLAYAAWSGLTDAARILIEAGADIENQDKNKWTPIMKAAHEGHIDLVELLLKKGAKPCPNGWLMRTTAISLAAKKGHKDIVGMLRPYRKRGYHQGRDV